MPWSAGRRTRADMAGKPAGLRVRAGEATTADYRARAAPGQAFGPTAADPRSLSESWHGPRSWRRGVGREAPRRLRCESSRRSGNDADGPAPPRTPWAHGDCGPMLRCSSSTMRPTSFPPRASPGTHKPHVRDPCDDSDRLLVLLVGPRLRIEGGIDRGGEVVVGGQGGAFAVHELGDFVLQRHGRLLLLDGGL